VIILKIYGELHVNSLFKLLGISNLESLHWVANKLSAKPDILVFYNNNMIFPSDDLLTKIMNYLSMSETEIKLRLGILDCNIINWIKQNPTCLLNLLPTHNNDEMQERPRPDFNTNFGNMYQIDCMELLRTLESNSIDLIFADPPFNLNKMYESGINDNVSEEKYLEWTEEWLLECVRVLSPGGALFVYNIPYWQGYISGILNKYLTFRHWIAINLKGLLPVAKKLNPSHYGLLYYIKGDKPKVFNTQRIPMSTCRHCGGEIHDYGGKKKSLKMEGLSLSDVWTDIHPVRHKKLKNRASNELPLKLLYRVISLASNEGDLVLDPFGGSGTTYIISEYLQRRWIGSEIGDLGIIIDRFENMDRDLAAIRKIESETNTLFTDIQRKIRLKNKFWLPEDF